MKIAFVIPSLANKGPIIFTQYLIDALKTLPDVDCSVFYFSDCKDCLQLELDVPTKKISFFKKYDFSSFDIVHTTMAKPDIYGRLHLRKYKWVVSMHNYFMEDLKLLYKDNFIKYSLYILVWNWALKKVRNVIVSSRAMLEYYDNLYPNLNYSIIPYGITKKNKGIIDSQDEEKIREFKEKKYFIIGSVGVLIYRKGFHQLISLLKNNSDVALILIGNGPEYDSLEKLAAENDVSDRLYMPGFKKDSYRYYQYFDAYAHVSYSEGFGLAMLEALSFGVPLICSDLAIYKEYFSDEDVAIFTPDNLISLQKAFNRVKAEKESFIEKSYRLYEKEFSSTNMAINHKKYYESLLGKKI